MIGGPFDRYTVRDETPKPGEEEYLTPSRYQRALAAAAHQHQGTTTDGRPLSWMTLPVQGRRRAR